MTLRPYAPTPFEVKVLAQNLLDGSKQELATVRTLQKAKSNK